MTEAAHCSPIDRGDVLFRLGSKADHGFVYDSWRKSHRSSPAVVGMDPETYFRYQCTVIARLLERSHLLVMCSPQLHDQIIGYAVVEELPDSELVYHYVFVKHHFRKWGLAKALVARAREAYRGRKLFASHMPRTGFLQALNRSLPITYDPGKQL